MSADLYHQPNHKHRTPLSKCMWFALTSMSVDMKKMEVVRKGYLKIIITTIICFQQYVYV